MPPLNDPCRWLRLGSRQSRWPCRTRVILLSSPPSQSVIYTFLRRQQLKKWPLALGQQAKATLLSPRPRGVNELKVPRNAPPLTWLMRPPFVRVQRTIFRGRKDRSNYGTPWPPRTTERQTLGTPEVKVLCLELWDKTHPAKVVG